MLLQRIQQHFVDSADLGYQCAPTLGPAVESGTAAVLAGLTGGGKVLACGCGVSAGLAQAFVASLVGRFERDRPELAALALGANVATLTSLYHGYEARDVFGRQVRALGQPGDVLLLVSAQTPIPELIGAVQAAHEREMAVVALCGAKPGDLAGLLKDTDVLIAVPTERLPRVHEMHLLALHCMCDGIDAQLLGDDTEPENPS